MPPNWLWGYLLPVGILLLIWGGLPPQRARRVTPLAALSTALAILGYWAVGFALHMGGAHAIQPDDPSLAGLDAMLPLVPQDLGWGVAGLAGFFLAGDAITPPVLALFLAYLPLIASAVTLVVLALSESRRWVMLVAGAVTGALVVPLAACWAWGSGWLFHLGETLGLGHGFVDFGGSGVVLWVPATFALGFLLLQPRRPVEDRPAPPPAYFPLLSNLGALLMGIGWAGWALSGPFHTLGSTWDWNRAGISLLLGIAGAILTSQLYAWLVTGEPEPLMSARGMGAGWGVILAGAPFLPAWGALITGLLGGLLFPLVLYGTEHYLRLRDSAATVSLGVTGGLGGLLSVAFLADGSWGQGWNGVGAFSGAGDAPAGVAGLFFSAEGGQLVAQLIGILALGLWGLLWGLLLGFAATPRWPRLSLSLPSLKRSASSGADAAPAGPDEGLSGAPDAAAVDAETAEPAPEPLVEGREG